jgi:predicted nucleic acid-binding protein
VGEIVYLDVCCFKRPFDDASQERIRREAQAVASALEAARRGTIRLVRSPAHDFENARNPREDRRVATDLWLQEATVTVSSNPGVADRARVLAGVGFSALDALHLAFAEASLARWFVTTDDRLLRRARSEGHRVSVEVLFPDELPLEQQEAE